MRSLGPSRHPGSRCAIPGKEEKLGPIRRGKPNRREGEERETERGREEGRDGGEERERKGGMGERRERKSGKGREERNNKSGPTDRPRPPFGSQLLLSKSN